MSLFIYVVNALGRDNPALDDLMPSLLLFTRHIMCRYKRSLLDGFSSIRKRRSTDGDRIKLTPESSKKGPSLGQLYKMNAKEMAKYGTMDSARALKSKSAWKSFFGASKASTPSTASGQYALMIIGGAIASPAVDALASHLRQGDEPSEEFKAKHKYDDSKW